MTSPPRRRRQILSPDQVARLVHMRDVEGLTWMTIGREFAKQDGECKRIYDRARSKPGAAASRAATAARPAKP